MPFAEFSHELITLITIQNYLKGNANDLTKVLHVFQIDFSKNEHSM
jgi:hypothetical protein